MHTSENLRAHSRWPRTEAETCRSNKE